MAIYTVPANANPQYANESGTFIDIDIVFIEPDLGEVRYTTAQFDSVDYSRELFQQALAGEFGPVAAYTPFPPEPDYVVFWDSLQGTGFYDSLMGQAATSLPSNAAMTQFFSVMGNAQNRTPDIFVVQNSIDLVFATCTFTEDEEAEFTLALEESNLILLYNVPPT